jgi:hypothetical protein
MIEIVFMALLSNICVIDNYYDDTALFDQVVEAGNDWSDKINKSNLITERSSEFYGNKLHMNYIHLTAKEFSNRDSLCSVTINTSIVNTDHYGIYDDENNLIDISTHTYENNAFVKIPDEALGVIIRHEMGHWFGSKHLIMMGDITGYDLTRKSIMYPILRLNDTSGITITEYDTNNIIPKIFRNPNF